MRYPDSGGMSAQARAKRESVRFEAADMFVLGLGTAEIAARLRVTRKSVNLWRRLWREGGLDALASKGPGGASCRLDDEQLQTLRKELDAGPAAHGWAEERWTLARMTELVEELFGQRYSLRGIAYLLERIGWSPQVSGDRPDADRRSIR